MIPAPRIPKDTPPHTRLCAVLALIYVPMMSIDGDGNVSIDWPEVKRCAEQPLPPSNSAEWPEAWHQAYTCQGMLMSRHSGYIEGQRNPALADPYLDLQSWSPRHSVPK
jgi:hypothetical protein